MANLSSSAGEIVFSELGRLDAMGRINTCSTCGKSEHDTKLLVCSNCKNVHYCSRECQRKGWKGHKQHCWKPGEALSDRTKLIHQGTIEWADIQTQLLSAMLMDAIPDGTLSDILLINTEYNPHNSNKAGCMKLVDGNVLPRVAVEMMFGHTVIWEQITKQIKWIEETGQSVYICIIHAVPKEGSGLPSNGSYYPFVMRILEPDEAVQNTLDVQDVIERIRSVAEKGMVWQNGKAVPWTP